MKLNKTKLPSSDSIRNAEEDFKSLLTKGTPLYLACGFDKQHLEALFVTAYNLYAEKKYKKALKAFELMVFYNHSDKRGWIGSGACYQMLHRYKDALSSYSQASKIDIQDPLPLFRAVECYIFLKMHSEALSALEIVKPLVEEKHEFAHLKSAVTKIEKLLQKSK